ncbi:hypothetical protein [Ectobacillus ponti]|uniref:Uncharacterized protein n=1 Tax=Ectobacillus ponti TaxID=2961894 RepID=A0AA41X727_9BACI|nr:hypothetical protein [Ectobacillus ponti]MCP8968388.1 hypothetical protein [Ectobacillus ponti]
MRILRTAILLGLLLTAACSQEKPQHSTKSDPTEPAPAQETKKTAPQKQGPSYTVLQDSGTSNMEQRTIHIQTSQTSNDQLRLLAESIQEAYTGKGFDSVHLLIYEQAGAEPVANCYMAYTDKGASLCGLDKAGTYRLETAEK